MRHFIPGTMRFYLTLSIVGCALWMGCDLSFSLAVYERFRTGIPTVNASGIPSRAEVVDEYRWMKSHGVIDEVPHPIRPADTETGEIAASGEEQDPWTNPTTQPASLAHSATTHPISIPIPIPTATETASVKPKAPSP